MNKNRRQFLGETLAATGLFFAASHRTEAVEHKAHHHHHHESNENANSSMVALKPGALITEMSAATMALVGAIKPELISKMKMPMPSDLRYDWHFIPKPRKGVPFKEMSEEQRTLAHALLRKGLGARGYEKVTTIISLENVLKEIEQGRGPVRDPENYFFTVFGEPNAKTPWGLSFEGHHISLNYTFANGKLANTPLFLGSNPGEVMQGPRKGTSPLAAEEKLGRELFKSLDSTQRASVLITEVAPKEILTSNVRKAAPLNPAGMAAGKLTGQQSEILMKLLKEYTSNMPAMIAERRMRELRGSGFNNIFFAWAGSAEPFQPHYYRLQGPGFLVEYDNVQNNANHIHTVWRDFQEDFGEDLLAEHHRQAHNKAHNKLHSHDHQV